MSNFAKSINIADLPLSPSSAGSRFAVQLGEISEALGLKGLGAMLHVVPPGKTAFPYHRHHVCDEMFLILSGAGEDRIGEERLPIRAGDCLGAPAGGSAHQIINTGTEELRYIGFSNHVVAEVVEYPDSGKLSVRAAGRGVSYEDATIGVRGRLTPAAYWDGEDVEEERD
jgi:uncharacterized cupin superfamily protein